jgi:hypothetical protein
VALHNTLGKGEVYWIAPSVSMSQLAKGESDELSHLADVLLAEKLAEQPNFKQPEKVENQNILERMKSFFRG